MVYNVIVPANKNNYPPVGFGKSWCMKQMMGSFKLFEYHRKIIGVLMMGFKESCDIKICVWELLLKKGYFHWSVFASGSYASAIPAYYLTGRHHVGWFSKSKKNLTNRNRPLRWNIKMKK